MAFPGGDVRQCIPLLVIVSALGCAEQKAASPASKPTASQFDPTTAGTVRGRVVWQGESPVVTPLTAPIPEAGGYRFDTKPNPFAPRIRNGGLGGVVVSLGSVSPQKSKPWPYPPATVEQAGHELRVRQGDGPPTATGFARVGDTVTVVSRDPGLATIRLRGASFATLPFPGPNLPLGRRVDRPGVVEVTSGTMLTWAACDLIVSDHPYHTLTRDDGTFELTDVPAGEYTLTVRVRNWHQTGHDRDPETGLISRRRFAPPVEVTGKVRVPTGGVAELTFTLIADQFR